MLTHSHEYVGACGGWRSTLGIGLQVPSLGLKNFIGVEEMAQWLEHCLLFKKKQTWVRILEPT